jgi:hypothetical protein
MVEELQSNTAGVTAEYGKIHPVSNFLRPQRKRRAHPNVSMFGDI